MKIRCLCKTGYKQHPKNHLKCIDFDECAEMTDHCPSHSTCANLGGSYECICNDGFISGNALGDSNHINEIEGLQCIPKENSKSRKKKNKKRKKKVTEIRKIVICTLVTRLFARIIL